MVFVHRIEVNVSSHHLFAGHDVDVDADVENDVVT